VEKLAGLAGLSLVALVLWEAFETVILPRRVTRRWRLTRFFYRFTWVPWSAVGRRLRSSKRREAFLSSYGPLSLLLLLGFWAAGLVLGFALLHWSFGSALEVPGRAANFRTDLYMSGTTFFTLGLGDVTPRSPLARLVTVTEAGVGFGFLAIIISYLPVIFGAFSRREVNISLLDAHAGSPPSGVELLQRHLAHSKPAALERELGEWERWSAELMESHLSYPVLCYFRSQHDNQSWLSALAAILDACAIVLADLEPCDVRLQAQMTFAIARHAVVDLSQVLKVEPRAPAEDRISPEARAHLREEMARCGAALHPAAASEEHLTKLRRMYEPHLTGLSARLLMPLPRGLKPARTDNWQRSPWDRNVTPQTGAEIEHDWS
jgi:hypothetical protein